MCNFDEYLIVRYFNEFLYENMEDSLRKIETILDFPDRLQLPRTKGGHRKAKTHHKNVLT